METKNKPVIADDVVVTLKYSVSVAGQVVESSADDNPIQFIQGRGDVIPGLENALYGLSVGDQKEFDVAPEDGYGEADPDAIAKIPKAEFPPEIPLQPGVELRLKDEQGDELEAQIVTVEDEIVRLNFNHPLAGKELLFAIQVIDIRKATPEELEHGHVH
ncbi:MAG: peptidylprolyl isomerase [Anaerolineales bacterium]|nr:peptidylprolyl isomerase [Anaerolineales bacterium]